MHVDWSTLSLSGYFEAFEAHGEANSPDKAKGLDKETAERLEKFNKAHGVN